MTDGRSGDGTGAVGCYPGSFDPPTVAHLAVAEAAVSAGRLQRLDLVLSTVALGKEAADGPSPRERAEVLEQVAATRPWLGVVVTERRLIVDIAASYDLVVMGADKWRQVTDPRWYADEPDGDAAAARDRAVAALPRVLVVPRAGDHPTDVDLLPLDPAHRHVRASDVRAGLAHAQGWMLPEAAEHATRTGAWAPPGR